jgi:hypothetical protein
MPPVLTSHEFARQLLAEEDLPVTVADYSYGLLSVRGWGVETAYQFPSGDIEADKGPDIYGGVAIKVVRIG